MGKKANGINSAKKLVKRRNQSLWQSRKYIKRTLSLKQKSEEELIIERLELVYLYLDNNLHCWRILNWDINQIFYGG